MDWAGRGEYERYENHLKALHSKTTKETDLIPLKLHAERFGNMQCKFFSIFFNGLRMKEMFLPSWDNFYERNFSSMLLINVIEMAYNLM